MKPHRTYNANLESSHKHSSGHRDEVLGSDLCGCFYCGEIFEPTDIEEWIDEQDGLGTTALCPRCSIDSVIGSRSGIALTPEFLTNMHDYWFG